MYEDDHTVAKRVVTLKLCTRDRINDRGKARPAIEVVTENVWNLRYVEGAYSRRPPTGG
jgi:hypothetical protein